VAAQLRLTQGRSDELVGDVVIEESLAVLREHGVAANATWSLRMSRNCLNNTSWSRRSQNARSERIDSIAINAFAFNNASGGTLRRPLAAATWFSVAGVACGNRRGCGYRRPQPSGQGPCARVRFPLRRY